MRFFVVICASLHQQRAMPLFCGMLLNLGSETMPRLVRGSPCQRSHYTEMPGDENAAPSPLFKILSRCPRRRVPITRLQVNPGSRDAGKAEKTFDGVVMKAKIQERLLHEVADLGDEEARRLRADGLSRRYLQQVVMFGAGSAGIGVAD